MATADGIGSMATAENQPESELVSPEENSVSGAVTAQAQPMLSPLAGISMEHSVRSIVNRYQDLTSPGPGEGQLFDKEAAESSVDSPSTSSEHVNEALKRAQYDSDLDVEPELPSLKHILGEDVFEKLEPKEKKRQEAINVLFHTEKAHLHNLKVLDILFHRPMKESEGKIMPELARSLFPNIEEVIIMHAAMNKAMKDKRVEEKVVGDLGDMLLEMFDGPTGDRFRKACAEYCRNQSYTLEALKKHRGKDQRLAQFLQEAEAKTLCRRLELKDQVPCQFQRLTMYPKLIEKLMKYTQSTTSDEYKKLEKALERSRLILGYVNQAVRECENYHKLKEMQRKLDKRPIDGSSDPSLAELKKLDLTQHKLVYDGPLVWQLRSHRLIELHVHVLLMEDILVLLQRVGDRLVLKCQSTNQQTTMGNVDYKYTHSPVLKLQNLLARNVATDKKAFFVINTSDTGPQMYELVAETQDSRKTWLKLINEKADETKRRLQPDEITMVRTRIFNQGQEGNSPPSDVDEAQAAALSPEQVSVSGAVTAQAQPMLSPLGSDKNYYVQRCVMIQKDERGYGLTVSGDNPVYVASVKAEGAAARAGVQKDDRIVMVNGTLVLNRNHMDVTKLIKAGSYVALTLMDKPVPSGGGQQQQTSNSSNRNSNPPQPVDPDKERELLQQNVHMTQFMYEQAREDFEKLQHQYAKTHTQLLEKERMVKTLQNQLKALTGNDEPSQRGESKQVNEALTRAQQSDPDLEADTI